ncbi:MAG: hypothetical protein H7A51_10900 [Akkermansiaceae bacterium]|nr:hypothetical protein [Akkermansiaceae bacterium]
MNITKLALICTALTMPVALADPASEARDKAALSQEDITKGFEKHEQGAKKLSTEQDELSADVQDLIDEQTDDEVIKLLREIEVIMADATDLLEQKKTDGATIATETEVIEKIFEAAKKKQQKGGGEGGQKSMESMLQMLQNMMNGGQDVGEGKEPGKEPGKGGDQPGQGGSGGGEAGGKTGAPDNTAENAERRVPKNSGSAGSALPREFQKAMDAYNKGAAQKSTKP